MNGGDIIKDKVLASDLEDDWAQFDRMTAEDRHLAASSDPDAQPVTPDNISKMRRIPQVRVIRRALGLTIDEFAARFHIPVETLKHWEGGLAHPDPAARAYLAVIGNNPEAVAEALRAAE